MAQSASSHDLVSVRVELEGAPEDLLSVVSMTGTEGISRLFQLEVTAVSTRGIQSDAMLGLGATVVFSRGEEEERRMFGIVASVHDAFDTESDHGTYRLVLVPRAFRMTLHETLDIFQDLTVPEIVEKKLQDAGLRKDVDYHLRLLDTYPKREFVVQYRETDLAFLSRLTEHVGLSFFFEHEGGRDVFVLTDHNGGFLPLSETTSLRFRARGDLRDVYKLESTSRLIPSEYLVRDYNYRTPQVELAARADLDGAGGRVVEYGAHFKNNDEAARTAKVRAEELLAARRVLEGESDVATLRAGATSPLHGHPGGDLDLLVTEVTHSVKQAALGGGADVRRYSNTFKAIHRSTTYRPPRVTPKPKVHGVLTGVVDPSKVSQYAELDSEGRYRVRFLFDTSDTPGGQASRPLRMMQPHAGAGYGMHFPLRGGVEVLIVCVDGDPDRPIIAGTVPNPQTASPVVAGNAPRNVIRTGGNNEINIDDTEDAQRIKLTTPKANTLLQLGAHNDPVEGVSLKTDGHASMAAVEGASQWSTLSMQMSALVDLLKAGNIVSVATAPNLWALAGVTTGYAQAVTAGTPGADTLTEANKSGIEKRRQDLLRGEAQKNKEAVSASQAAKAKLQECNLCRLAAKNKLPPTSQQDSTIQALIADYEAAAATCDDVYLSAIGTMEDRNGIVDVHRFNLLNDNFEPVMNRDAYASLSTYDYPAFESLMVSLDNNSWNALTEAQKAALINPSDPGDQAAKLAAAKQRFLDAQKLKWIALPVTLSDADAADYDALRAAQGTTFDALTPAQKDAIPDSVWKMAGITIPPKSYAALTDAQKAALKAAYVNNAYSMPPDTRGARDAKLAKLMTALAGNTAYAQYKTALEGCGAKCKKELDEARAAAVAANEVLARTMADNTASIYELQRLTNENQRLTERLTYTSMSINALLTLYATIEAFLARSSTIDRWKAAKEISKNSAADAATLEIYDKVKRWQIPFYRPQHTHVIGSEQSTEIYGQRDAIMWSKTAMLLGMGSKKDLTWKEKVASVAAAGLLPGGPGATPDPTVGRAIVMGMQSAQLLSPRQVSIQAGWDPKEVNAKGRTSIELFKEVVMVSAKNQQNVDAATLNVWVGINNQGMIRLGTAGERRLDISEDPPKVTLQAGQANSLVMDEQANKVTLKTNANYYLDLDHAATASLLKGGVWELKLHEGGANGVTLGLEAGWRLKIKDNDVDLGTAGAGAKLHITNADTTLTSAADLKLNAPNNIKMIAPTVDFAGAQIQSANLLVKADLANEPVIGQLRARIQTAQQAAAVALVSAMNANLTAQQALAAVQPPPPGPPAAPPPIMDLPDID